MSAPKPAAAILAGGQARRFGGRDKSRLTVDGRSIIIRQIDVLQRVADEIFVVASLAERFADLGLPVHADVVPGCGALGGIHTALVAAHRERVIVVACDLPFLDAGLLARLNARADAAGVDGAWVRTARGVEPLLACYRRGAEPRLRARIDAGRLKAADLGEDLRMAVVDEAEVAEFGPVARLLANVNTPEEYARVQLPAS